MRSLFLRGARLKTMKRRDREQKAWETIAEMMTDRGFEEHQLLSLEPNRKKFLYAKSPSRNYGCAHKVDIRLLAEPKIGISHIKTLIDPKAQSSYIFLSAQGLTPKARKACRTYRDHGVNIEVFLLAELQYNVIRHAYCPVHRLCSKEEKGSVLRKLGISPKEETDKLPCIQAQDPVIRYLGAPKGTLVAILRESSTFPTYKELTYRLVTGDLF